jgi:D-alanyl-D-alanine carboxypeptidase
MFTRLVIIFLILTEQVGLGLNVSKPPTQILYNNNSLKNKQEQVLSTNLQPLAERNPSIPPPQIEAASCCVLDMGTNKILWEKEANVHRPMASTTKIMTALVVLDHLKLSDIVKISSEAIASEGDSMSLYSGEEIKVEDLLYGLLLSSSNDAAVSLAEHISGTVSEFAKLINKKVEYLGLRETSFHNPAGFDAPSNYTTAKELAFLTSYALKNPIFSQIVKTENFQFTSISGISHQLVNSNKLLMYDDRVVGVKTGFTDKAGDCVVISAIYKGHQIIIVLLDSPDRFTESQKLIDWTFSAYWW